MTMIGKDKKKIRQKTGQRKDKERTRQDKERSRT